MSFLTILFIALGLAMDAFAVAIATSSSLGKVSGRQTFRLSFHFGLFQAVMPVIGWLGGVGFVKWVDSFGQWIAFGLLAFIGGKMIYESLAGEDENKTPVDPTRGFSLVMLSFATSIDALAVGLSFAMLKVSVWYPSAIIGIVAAVITFAGMRLGGKLGEKFGKRTELAGGIILIAIGLKIIIQ